MPSKRIFTALIVVTLACAAIWLWRSGVFSKNDTGMPTFISDKEAIVEMRDDGFYPPVIKIKKGTMARFVNKDKLWHWPASDLHPTHSIYPEFDPKKPVGPGEEWSFTFEKVGEWGYHDHLSPYVLGKIIVFE